MNDGAVAGGVVGGVIFLVAIGLIAWCLRRRKRQARINTAPAMAQEHYQDHGPPVELGHYGPRRVQLEGTPRHELYGKEGGREVGGNPIYEMPHDNPR